MGNSRLATGFARAAKAGFRQVSFNELPLSECAKSAIGLRVIVGER